MAKTRVMVEFSVYGDAFNPEVVTERLGITPRKYWHKGDTIKKGGIQKRKETCWIIGTEYEESLDTDEQLYKVLDLLERKAGLLKELREMYDLKFKIDIVVKVENRQPPSMTFGQRIIDFVHEINAWIDIDSYIYS